MRALTLITDGASARLDGILAKTLTDCAVARLTAAEALKADLRGRTLLFAVALDAGGMSLAVCALLRRLRTEPDCLAGSRAALIVDGPGETDTKDLARDLVFAANRAGCRFPGKPLTEATGSLKNLRMLQKKQGLPNLEAAYEFAVRALLDRLFAPLPLRPARPKILLLHASDRETSNTLWLGEQIAARLRDDCGIGTVNLRSGTIHDCRGCSFKVCSHYAQNNACFYGGVLNEDVFPAVLESDALLLLCPNYNDAVGANITAFINRLTGLAVNDALAGKAVYAVVVSGYSGGDLVAKQLLGALCLNKSMLLPPRFCLLETANDRGEAAALPGIEERLSRFAEAIKREMLNSNG